ncbi:MAG: methylenetetrahydrofolate reductase, partial [Paracoccaceae bacterium]
PTQVVSALAAHKAAHTEFNVTNVHFFPLGGIKTNATWATQNSGAAMASANT